MQPIERVLQLMAACGTDAAVLPPTILFNEGWLLRLVLDWYARNHPENGVVQFANGSQWRSEVLLPSRFFRSAHPEGWTHADAVIGHFRVRHPRGDAVLLPDATQFVVIEAKMGGPLSVGTRHALTFNQAARNVACMLHMLSDPKRAPGAVLDLAFIVFAPQQRIDKGIFVSALDKPALRHAIRSRVAPTTAEHEAWCTNCVDQEVTRMRIEAITWENLMREIATLDPAYSTALMAFYIKCCQFNGLRSPVAA